MLQKIQEFAATVKAVLLWVVGPLLLVGAFLYSALGKPKDYSAEKELIESLEKKATESAQEAEDDEEEYRRIRNDYVKSRLSDDDESGPA